MNGCVDTRGRWTYLLEDVISESSLVNSENSILRNYSIVINYFIDKKKKILEAEESLESWAPPARLAQGGPFSPWSFKVTMAKSSAGNGCKAGLITGGFLKVEW